jgi:LDH2 family malate/lactate/ureidoglycolate dehydrogenase
VPERDAFLVADALIDADLRGVSTHGLVRFPVYTNRVRKRLVNPTPTVRVVSTKGAVRVLDGDNGFGQVARGNLIVAAIFLPGELEFRRREERLRDGLSVNAAVFEDARVIGRELGVAWPA